MKDQTPPMDDKAAAEAYRLQQARELLENLGYCGLCSAEKRLGRQDDAHADLQAEEQAYSAGAGGSGQTGTPIQ